MKEFIKSKIDLLVGKKDRFEEIETRVDKVFALLVSDAEFAFTELESVQICNSVRRKLSEHLKEKRSNELEISVLHNQKAIEINVALDFIE